MQFDEKHGILYIVTRGGILFLFEVSTGAKILASKVSIVHIVTGAENTETGGILILNVSG